MKGAVWTVDEVEFYKRRPQRCVPGYVLTPDIFKLVLALLTYHNEHSDLDFSLLPLFNFHYSLVCRVSSIF